MHGVSKRILFAVVAGAALMGSVASAKTILRAPGSTLNPFAGSPRVDPLISPALPNGGEIVEVPVRPPFRPPIRTPFTP